MIADVVVVTWRSGERVLRCLERLTAQPPAARIFVVDNASRDGTVEGVRERFAGVRVHELEENVGFGRAVNAGAELGDGEALVLVNDDVEVEDGFIEAITEPLARDPRCGMVAGMTMLGADGLVDSFGIELDVTLAAYNRLRRRGPNERAGRLAMPSGALAAYRRAAFEQVGGFAPGLFVYGEDLDLGLRLRAAGWSAAEAPGARGVHAGGASVGRDSSLQRALFGFARARRRPRAELRGDGRGLGPRAPPQRSSAGGARARLARGRTRAPRHPTRRRRREHRRPRGAAPPARGELNGWGEKGAPRT
jgi:GT2 family glycosyltransferase